MEGREGEGGPPALTPICFPKAMLSSCTNRAFRCKCCQRTPPCHHLKALGGKVLGFAEALSFSLGAQSRLPCGSQPCFCSCWTDGPSSGGGEQLWWGWRGPARLISLLASLSTERPGPWLGDLSARCCTHHGGHLELTSPHRPFSLQGRCHFLCSDPPAAEANG